MEQQSSLIVFGDQTFCEVRSVPEITGEVKFGVFTKA